LTDSFNEALKVIEKYYKPIRDAFWVTYYDCTRKLVKAFLNEIETTEVLTKYKGQLRKLVEESKAYRRKLLLDKEFEPVRSVVLYTVIAPVIHEVMILAHYLKTVEIAPYLMRKVITKNRQKLIYFMSSFELEERSIFEIRVLILTHYLFLKHGKKHCEKVNKMLIERLKEESPGGIWDNLMPRVKVIPIRSLSAQLWARRAYANIVIIDRRLHMIVYANDIEFEELKSEADRMVELFLRTLIEAEAMEESCLEPISKLCQPIT